MANKYVALHSWTPLPGSKIKQTAYSDTQWVELEQVGREFIVWREKSNGMMSSRLFWRLAEASAYAAKEARRLGLDVFRG